MLHTTELDTKSAGFYAYAAARDASMKSYAASTAYTLAERTRAQRTLLGLELAYSSTAQYITYRKKFVVIKLENARVRDRASLRALEAQYEREGISKTVTAQAVSYRIPKI